MNVIGTGEARRQELRSYLADVLEGRKTGNEWTHPFGTDVTEAVFGNMRAGIREWRNGMEAGIEKLKAQRSILEENLEEFYDIFL